MGAQDRAGEKPVKVFLRLAALDLMANSFGLPNRSAKDGGSNFKSFEEKVHFFPFFPSGEKTRAEGRRVTPTRLLAPRSLGPKRRGLTRLTRSVQSLARKMGWLHPYAACSW